MNDFTQYENKNRRCHYPFTPDPLGYCWSFANHVDGDSRFKNIQRICSGCNSWAGSREYRRERLRMLRKRKQERQHARQMSTLQSPSAQECLDKILLVVPSLEYGSESAQTQSSGKGTQTVKFHTDIT